MNMVREIKFASGTVTKLGYDARAKLAWKDVDGTPTYFGCDGLNALFEKNAAGATTAEYVCGHSDIHGIGGMTEAVVGGTRYVPEFNGVGDLVGVLDADGNEVYRCVYDAFGRVLSETGTNPLPFESEDAIQN